MGSTQNRQLRLVSWIVSHPFSISLAQNLYICRPFEQLIFNNTQHTGPVRGLDFNPLQHHLLSSGGTNGEAYVWDLKNPGTPGARSSKLDKITALAWSNHESDWLPLPGFAFVNNKLTAKLTRQLGEPMVVARYTLLGSVLAF